MKVAFDSRPAKGRHGIARYSRCLLDALKTQHGEEIIESHDPRRVDVFHAPWIDGAMLRCPVPMVVTLHDLIPLKRHGQLLRSGLRLRMRYLAVQRAARVIVPTRVVAEEAIAGLGIAAERLAVIPEAPAEPFYPRPGEEVEAVRARFRLPARYLLWVGGMRTPDPRKRVAALARAPRKLPLVLVGSTGRWAHELPGVTLTGTVSDDELAGIYTGAHALVFPSDDEGFGLAPVEALACGTPVVACDVPALREVLGDRAHLHPVEDIEGLIKAAEAAERPAPQLPSWTWDAAAAATWKVYEAAAGRTSGGGSGAAPPKGSPARLSADQLELR